MQAWAVGLDLAWSPCNLSGVALARVEPEQVAIEWTGLMRSLDDMVERIAELRHGGGRMPITIAVDAPTIVPNREGARAVERELQRRFGARHAGPYPANRRRLGRYNADRPRGEELVALLRRRLGAAECGLPPPRHGGLYVMEVFPAAALVELFGLERGLRYKKKPGRSWSTCRQELRRLLELLEGLRGPRAWFRQPLVVGNERGVAFKRLEDQVDAACCAYLAALAWLGGERRLELVGSLEEGYIVLPRGQGGPARP